MEIKELNVDNVEDYEGILDPDVSESIGREYFRGIVAEESGAPAGAMIWEYKNLEEDEDTDAEICFIHSDSAAVIKTLLSDYESQAASEEVQKTFFELIGLSENTKQGLTEDGFTVSSGEGRDLAVFVSDLKPLTSPKRKLTDKVVGLEELMMLQFMQGVTNCLFHGKKGIVEDLEFIDREWFDDKVSSAVIHDGKVSGMLLVHRFPSGTLMPVLFTAIGPDYRSDLMNMLVYSARKASEVCDAGTRVVLRRHDDSVTALTNKLFAGKRGAEVVRGSRG